MSSVARHRGKHCVEWCFHAPWETTLSQTTMCLDCSGLPLVMGVCRVVGTKGGVMMNSNRFTYPFSQLTLAWTLCPAPLKLHPFSHWWYLLVLVFLLLRASCDLFYSCNQLLICTDYPEVFSPVGLGLGVVGVVFAWQCIPVCVQFVLLYLM